MSEFTERALAACVARAPYSTASPWWQSLETDFAGAPEPFELQLRERAQVAFAAMGDVMLRTLGACVVGSLALPLGYHPLGLYRGLRDRTFYGDLTLRAGADAFFAAPPEHIKISRKRARFPLFSPDDGECDDIRFTSPFIPVNPKETRAYLAVRANRTAHARHFRHRRGPRSTVIAIHGFSADLSHFNEWFFAIPWLYKSGFDVLLVTLPFHGSRRSTFSPLSGSEFFTGGTGRINEALAQAVFELRIFMDSLFRSGVPQIGVTGMSLGGLTATLLASADARLAFAIPNVPVVSLADLVLEWEPIGTFVRAGLRAIGKDIRTARQMLAPSSPLSFQPKLAKERLFIIGGVGDRLSPPKQARLLWDHWGRPRMHWFPGSHILHLDRGQYFREMRKFFGQIGFNSGWP